MTTTSDNSPAPDAPELKPEVARAIATYQPRWPSPEDEAALPEVLPQVRQWVTATMPEAASTAHSRMSKTTIFAIWGLKALGTLDETVLMTDHNVEHFSRYVNAHRTNRWQHNTRTALRGVARVVNPEAWPPRSRAIPGYRRIAPPYTPKEEERFIDAALMPGRRRRSARIWMVCASAGAGMTGGEIALSVLDDVVKLPKGRFAVHVRGHSPRLVPVRERYSDLVREVLLTTKASGTDKLIPSGPQAIFHLARNLLGDSRAYPGDPGFKLVRARHTWLVAHMLANTPTWALRALSGGVSHQTVQWLDAYINDGRDPREAVKLGMGA